MAFPLTQMRIRVIFYALIKIAWKCVTEMNNSSRSSRIFWDLQNIRYSPFIITHRILLTICRNHIT